MNDVHPRDPRAGLDRGRDNRSGLFSDPGRIAPSLEKSWRDDFILELRLLSVPGDRIGDALVTAETHVQESGERAQEAFGDPRTYARETAESCGASAVGRQVDARAVLSTTLGLLGMVIAVWAFAGLLAGLPVEVTVGGIVSLGALLALATGLFASPERVLRLLVARPVLSSLLAPLVLVTLFVGILLLFPQVLFTVAAVPVGVVAGLLLAASAWLTWEGSSGEDDAITGPGEPRHAPGRGRLVATLTLPVMTVLILGLTWALNRLA